MQLGAIETLKGIQIQTGCVFRMTLYPQDGVVPKGHDDTSRTKYFVIIGIDDNGDYVGISLINSNINARLCNTIRDYQLCIYPDKYEFLGEHERYVDCYSLKEIERTRILQNGDYIGYIDEDDIEKIRTLLKSSPVIDDMTIQKYSI